MDSKQVGPNSQYKQRKSGSYIQASSPHKESVQATKWRYWWSSRQSKPAEAGWDIKGILTQTHIHKKQCLDFSRKFGEEYDATGFGKNQGHGVGRDPDRIILWSGSWSYVSKSSGWQCLHKTLMETDGQEEGAQGRSQRYFAPQTMMSQENCNKNLAVSADLCWPLLRAASYNISYSQHLSWEAVQDKFYQAH